MNFRIVQTSPMRTASTLLTNVLYGLFTPDLPVCYCHYLLLPKKQSLVYNMIQENLIIKTHIPHTELTKLFSEYVTYYVSSCRSAKGCMIPQDDNPYLVTVDYDLLTGSAETVVNNVFNLLLMKFPSELISSANKSSAIKRIVDMNERYEQIKDLPFKYYDPFYKIHGHHCNRDDILS
jgi:hypothetical protein